MVKSKTKKPPEPFEYKMPIVIGTIIIMFGLMYAVLALCSDIAIIFKILVFIPVIFGYWLVRRETSSSRKALKQILGTILQGL